METKTINLVSENQAASKIKIINEKIEWHFRIGLIYLTIMPVWVWVTESMSFMIFGVMFLVHMRKQLNLELERARLSLRRYE